MCGSKVHADEGNASSTTTSTSHSISSSSSSSLPQHELPRVRRSRNRNRRASIETSSPSTSSGINVSPPTSACSVQVDRISVRDVSVKVDFDQSLCIDVGRTFRRDSLLVSKTTYMSRSSEKLVQQQKAVESPSSDDQKRRVRFAEKGKCKIISRIDDIDPQSAQSYWYSRDDRTRNEQKIMEETKMFRKLHKITKSRRRQSLQEGSKLGSSNQQREEELLWAVIDAKSYCVRGLEHFIDRRMYTKMKEEQDGVVDSVLRAQDELGPDNHEALASVSASLTKNARLRASLLGMEDQEAVQALRWEEAQQGAKESNSSLRAF